MNIPCEILQEGLFTPLVWSVVLSTIVSDNNATGQENTKQVRERLRPKPDG
jgi:hypothetical protein